MKKIITIIASGLLIANSLMAQISLVRNSAFVGTTITVSGIVTNGSELGKIRYLQDAGAGISIYGTNITSIVRGDSITATGTLTEYNGLFEMNPVASFTIHGLVTAPAAQIITPSQISEAYESQLLQFDNCTFAAGGSSFAGNTNYPFTSGGQTGTVRVATGSPLVGVLIPSGVVSIKGILSQYCSSPTSGCTTGYQLLPRDINDLVAPGGISFSSQLLATNLTTTGFQINWTTNITPTETFVNYGLTSALELGSVAGTFSGSNNTVVLSGLTAGTIYYAKAYSVNGTDTSYSGVRVFGTVSNSTGDIKVYFNRSVDTLQSNSPANNAIVLASAIDDTLIAYINRAKYTIDFTIYNFDNNNISNITAALNAAHARGVKIRAVYDGGQSNLGFNNLDVAIGRIASPTSSAYGIMHSKFVIFDGNSADPNDCILWTGSANWTDNQINTDNQNVIIFQDQTMCHSYKLEFNELFGDTGLQPNAANAKFGPDKKDNTAHEFLVGGRRVEQYFSPTDGVNTQILKTLNSANTDMEVEIMIMTRTDLGYAIANRKQAGVNCYFLTNDTGSTITPNISWTIVRSALGAKAKKYNQGGIMHSKYVIVDQSNPASDPLVLTGSHNWSNGADQKNDENTVIVHDANIANKYYQEYVQRFNLNGGLILAVENSPNVSVPFHAYPNPSNGEFQLLYALDKVASCKIEIFDLEGKKVYTSATAGKSGINEYIVDGKNLAKGMYVVRLSAGSVIKNQKLVIE